MPSKARTEMHMRGERMQQMMKNRVRQITLAGLATVVIGAAGCAGGSNNSGSNTPVPPAGTSGTQSLDGSKSKSTGAANFHYGGSWSRNIDSTDNYFTYQNIGHEEVSILISDGEEIVIPAAIPVTGS